MLKLLGDRAEEFFDVYRISHRIIMDKSGIKYDLGLALPIYDVENLDGFEIMKFDDLSEDDRKKLKHLENEYFSEE